MDRGRDKQSKGPGEPRNPREPGEAKAAEAGKAAKPLAPGGVVVDQRGRNVWQFHGESIDSTSMMLQRLDNPSLSLEPTRRTKRIDSNAATAPGQSAGKDAAATVPPGKAQIGATKRPSGPTKGQPALVRKSGQGQRVEDHDSDHSFEQSFSVKPGKNSGGGFDPYNNS